MGTIPFKFDPTQVKKAKSADYMKLERGFYYEENGGILFFIPGDSASYFGIAYRTSDHNNKLIFDPWEALVAPYLDKPSPEKQPSSDIPVISSTSSMSAGDLVSHLCRLKAHGVI